jgi:hypothetical protein
MRTSLVTALIAACTVAAVTGGAAQVASTPGAPTEPGQKLTLNQVGLIIYPGKGQPPEQQAKDEEACTAWAETQTGIQVGGGSVNTDSAAMAAGDQAAEATQGAAVAGAARGAAGGAIFGAIAGDAGEGAAIGAVAGAIGGRRAKKRAEHEAEAQGAAQAQAQNQAMVDQFKKAATVCLEGRGYSVK